MFPKCDCYKQHLKSDAPRRTTKKSQSLYEYRKTISNDWENNRAVLMVFVAPRLLPEDPQRKNR